MVQADLPIFFCQLDRELQAGTIPTKFAFSSWLQFLPLLAVPVSAPYNTVRLTGTAQNKEEGLNFKTNRLIPNTNDFVLQIYSLFNFWSTVNELMVPEFKCWIFNQFNEGD